ncbi:P-loop containing nucleoside triphosphate hydrolase protein [Amniculicola lignicola CBS 123094]|uniref:P-loop containing nucleoside triphosphate hydrolase protein n=1 Tax=Amniculicola lignicola CBS 123094 TaxID=1392246 RepID=A0A6A5VYR3_9PLEO|nr:P-loop containing nucleoside triphosphate hydrolase protein [Amniculicola lignicola CBS 123094]
MASKESEIESLEQLQSSEQVNLLNAIDNLRNQGLGHHDISLPQLITVGDQSAGKSSVLEALTRLRFPTKDDLCTTFATELVLRKSDNVKISCVIIPSGKRSPAAKKELSKFARTYPSREAFSFPSLIEDARECMKVAGSSLNSSFFQDILQIKYTGPDLPSLTIVDLPGFIHNGRGDDVETVRTLIEGYMRQSKSIILAVVSAKNDLGTQVVIELIKRIDNAYDRTLGIITKPDTLDAGSDMESKFLSLAKNQLIPFNLGWHMVKNRGYSTREQTDTERDESERSFFDSGVWASLPRSDVGIDTLRTKLSKVLLHHIRTELPSLIKAIRDAAISTESSLKMLGDARETRLDQLIYLVGKAERFQKLTNDALSGSYNDQFFSLSSPSADPASRLRTHIQNLNLSFAQTMYTIGHKWDIVDGGEACYPHRTHYPATVNLVDYSDASFEDPEPIERTKFLEEHIGARVRQSRQSGLPSLVNTGVINEIFREQSEPWEAIAEAHLLRVFNTVDDYVGRALGYLMDDRTRDRLELKKINVALEVRQQAAHAKLKELLHPYRHLDPMIYDPSFATEMEALRAKHAKSFKPTIFDKNNQLLTSIDDFTNSEILDLVQTYYKKVISIFISNVAVLAVETCLVAKLDSIFSPTLVHLLSDEDLDFIAAESEEIQTERASLSLKLEDLKAGKKILDLQACNSGTGLRTPMKSRGRQVQGTPRTPRTRTPIGQSDQQGPRDIWL